MSCKKCKTSQCTCETSLCVNPLIYMIKEAFSLVGTDGSDSSINNAVDILNDISKDNSYTNNGNIYDIPLALVQVLINGISVSNNETICCPDCKNGIYVIGNRPVMVDIISAETPPKLCCIEHQSSLFIWNSFLSQWNEVYDNTNIKCCDTDFSEVIKLWIASSNSAEGEFYLSEIIERGIFESSSFNGMSGLGILYTYIKTLHSDFTAADYLNILGVITNLGVVVECKGCSITISSAKTFIEFDYFLTRS